MLFWTVETKKWKIFPPGPPPTSSSRTPGPPGGSKRVRPEGAPHKPGWQGGVGVPEDEAGNVGPRAVPLEGGVPTPLVELIPEALGKGRGVSILTDPRGVKLPLSNDSQSLLKNQSPASDPPPRGVTLVGHSRQKMAANLMGFVQKKKNTKKIIQRLSAGSTSVLPFT